MLPLLACTQEVRRHDPHASRLRCLSDDGDSTDTRLPTRLAGWRPILNRVQPVLHLLFVSMTRDVIPSSFTCCHSSLANRSHRRHRSSTGVGQAGCSIGGVAEMGRARDCFEAGLFLTGILWGDPSQRASHTIVCSQAKEALGKLGMSDKTVAKFTKTESAGINDRLRWVSEAAPTRKKLGESIESQYGPKGGACYNVGVALGDMMFVSGILAGSDWLVPKEFDTVRAAVEPFAHNLAIRSIEVGNPALLDTVVSDAQDCLSKPSKLGGLPAISGKCGGVAQNLAIWLDVNVIVEKKPGRVWRTILGLIQGIPYVGKGIAEFLKSPPYNSWWTYLKRWPSRQRPDRRKP